MEDHAPPGQTTPIDSARREKYPIYRMTIMRTGFPDWQGRIERRRIASDPPAPEWPIMSFEYEDGTPAPGLEEGFVQVGWVNGLTRGALRRAARRKIRRLCAPARQPEVLYLGDL